MDDVLIVGAVRTAIGKFGGTLARIPASDLGAHVISALLKRTGVKPDMVNDVIMGQVLTAAAGQNPARQAAIKAGIPDMVPGMTINKVCGSGLKATHLAAQAIKAGDAEIVIAGGQGKELAGKVIRIATMGAVGRAELETGLKALEQVLKSGDTIPISRGSPGRELGIVSPE